MNTILKRCKVTLATKDNRQYALHIKQQPYLNVSGVRSFDLKFYLIKLNDVIIKLYTSFSLQHQGTNANSNTNINLFMLNVFSHPYQLNEFISSYLRVDGWYFQINSNFQRNF